MRLMKLYLFTMTNELRFYATEEVGMGVADRLWRESDGRVTLRRKVLIEPVESVEAFFAPEVKDETA
jgi:hypothetical protein